MRSMYRVLIKKKRLHCTTKTVNLHVRLTQINTAKLFNELHLLSTITGIKVQRKLKNLMH